MGALALIRGKKGTLKNLQDRPSGWKTRDDSGVRRHQEEEKLVRKKRVIGVIFGSCCVEEGRPTGSAKRRSIEAHHEFRKEQNLLCSGTEKK